jgi:hypothetical protein
VFTARYDEPTHAQMINHLLYYSCYNAATCFDATAPPSGGSWSVPVKLYKHLNAELVIFLNFTHCLLLKFEIIKMLKYFSYNKIILSWIPDVADPRLSLGIFPRHPTIPCARGRLSLLKHEYQDTPEGIDGRCVRLTTYHIQAPKSRNREALSSQNPLGPIGQ